MSSLATYLFTSGPYQVQQTMAIPLRGLEGVPGLPGAPQDEAGLTRKFETLAQISVPGLDSCGSGITLGIQRGGSHSILGPQQVAGLHWAQQIPSSLLSPRERE